MVEHVTVPSIVKDNVEVDMLESIGSLTQTILQCVRPLVEPSVEETCRPRAPPHHCGACGVVCTYNYQSAQDAAR